MAGEKMMKESKMMMCENCGTCMGKMCGSVCSILVLVAGLSFLAFGFGKLDGMLAHMVSGAALVLYGLGLLVHALGFCKCACK